MASRPEVQIDPTAILWDKIANVGLVAGTIFLLHAADLGTNVLPDMREHVAGQMDKACRPAIGSASQLEPQVVLRMSPEFPVANFLTEAQLVGSDRFCTAYKERLIAESGLGFWERAFKAEVVFGGMFFALSAATRLINMVDPHKFRRTGPAPKRDKKEKPTPEATE